MSDKTALGDRMKRHELPTRTVLPRRTYTILRVDGRAFHSYLRGARKPFDEAFMADMDEVMQALCEEISGAALGYAQSDEISVLYTDFGSTGTEPWFGGVLAKQTTIAASLATAVLNERRGGRALFDARAFTLTDPVEVANYFLWRQRDAVRNSITMAAQSVFSHKRLHGVNSDQKQELLFTEAGINWNDYPDGCKRGRVATRRTGEREVVFTDRRTGVEQAALALRSWWEVAPAPRFTAEPDGFLAETIPALPSLAGAGAELAVLLGEYDRLHGADEPGYAALAAMQDGEDRAYHAAMRARQRRGDGRLRFRAVTSPWPGGGPSALEILVKGDGFSGATQADTPGDVEMMARDLVARRLDVPAGSFDLEITASTHKEGGEQ